MCVALRNSDGTLKSRTNSHDMVTTTTVSNNHRHPPSPQLPAAIRQPPRFANGFDVMKIGPPDWRIGVLAIGLVFLRCFGARCIENQPPRCRPDVTPMSLRAPPLRN